MDNNPNERPPQERLHTNEPKRSQLTEDERQMIQLSSEDYAKYNDDYYYR